MLPALLGCKQRSPRLSHSVALHACGLHNLHCFLMHGSGTAQMEAARQKQPTAGEK